MFGWIVQLVRMLVPKTGDIGSSPIPPTMTDYNLIINELKKSLVHRRCFYGETYDTFGITVDSLKYYLFLSLLHQNLARPGVSCESVVIIADVATGINQSSQKFATAISQISQDRLNYCQKLKKYYHLPINFVLMSDFFTANPILQRVESFKKVGRHNPQVIELLSKTVLQNKIKQEIESGFHYGFEEIATGSFFDIKIGPPREQYYDQAAAIISRELRVNQLSSIYLSPTYPLGQDFSYFLTHPEIEEFGLTPYKAGSNQLQDFRIIIGRDNHLAQLFQDTYLTTNPTLPNPILDLLFITDMAQKIKNNDPAFPVYNADIYSDVDSLKRLTLEKTTALLVELNNL